MNAGQSKIGDMCGIVPGLNVLAVGSLACFDSRHLTETGKWWKVLFFSFLVVVLLL